MTDQNVELEQRLKEQMSSLVSHVGKNVTVEHVWYGRPDVEQSKLKSVDEYVNISIEGMGIPFIGSGSAIQRITGEDGTVLYENPLIADNYDVRRDEQRDILVAKCFGNDIANRFKDEREKSRQEWDAKKAMLDADARGMHNDYLKAVSLVKPDTADKWKEYVSKNTQDFYSAGVVEASVKVMQALTEGKSPKEAEKSIDDLGISGFMAGYMAQTVSYFHPRGEEFRQHWNGQYMPKEEAKRAKGVVNPAILTISSRE